MKSVAELNALYEKLKDNIILRQKDSDKSKAPGKIRRHILICAGTGCVASGCQSVMAALEESLEKHGIKDEIKIIATGCHGLCAVGPLVIVHPDAIFYSYVEADDIEEIVTEHLVGGKPVKRKIYHDAVQGDEIVSYAVTPFFKHQHKIALKNSGYIDPEDIEEYIAFEGYQALGKVLTEMTPEDVIKTVKDAKLRGRGGGGFPAGTKWEFAYKQQSDKKYVICNADEGDPGAFMDRSILEGDPHAVIEAMAIAGYAIGADEGYVYIRAEYPIAVTRLNIALKQAREMGFLGKDIFGTGFNFEIRVRLGAGAFVCGEETALIASIEGRRGEPRPRPPFPAVKGLFGKPTVLNNVETYANIPPIILKGADWFTSMGTEKSKGTKVFAVGGKITNVGLVEVEMGTTLRQVVEDVGGGVPDGKKFKAAQTGGPSGGCIPASLIDTPIDFDSLIEVGSMMGSGGLIIMDEDTCMVDIARYFLDFTVDESCGKCTPCRVGTRRMYEMLEKIISGGGELEDLDKLEELALHVKASSLCGLGQTAPNPILSTLRYFRHEYEEHIKDKKCSAGVCKALLQYFILEEKCKGCTLCIKACPTNAITGKVKELHVIDQAKCVKCDACVEKCKFNAIIKQ